MIVTCFETPLHASVTRRLGHVPDDILRSVFYSTASKTLRQTCIQRRTPEHNMAGCSNSVFSSDFLAAVFPRKQHKDQAWAVPYWWIKLILVLSSSKVSPGTFACSDYPACILQIWTRDPGFNWSRIWNDHRPVLEVNEMRANGTEPRRFIKVDRNGPVSTIPRSLKNQTE